jgi:hypothetical protein
MAGTRSPPTRRASRAIGGAVRTGAGGSKVGSTAVQEITKLDSRRSSPLTAIGHAAEGGAVLVGAVLLAWAPEVEDQPDP